MEGSARMSDTHLRLASFPAARIEVFTKDAQKLDDVTGGLQRAIASAVDKIVSRNYYAVIDSRLLLSQLLERKKW